MKKRVFSLLLSIVMVLGLLPAVALANGGEPEAEPAAEYDGPVILAEPNDFYASVGDTATFQVDADGDGLTYRWYYMTADSGVWTAVKNNGTSATYSLTVAARHDGNVYHCVVTDAGGETVMSRDVRLRVLDEEEDAPTLRLCDRMYIDDEPAVDGEGNPVYNWETDELTMPVGGGQVLELWYGDKRLTQADIDAGDLEVLYDGGMLSMQEFPDGGMFLELAGVFEDEYAEVFYRNTNLEEGNSVRIYEELPMVGAYFEPLADMGGIITAYDPLEISEETVFYVVCKDEDWTISAINFYNNVQDHLSCEPVEPDEDECSPVWFVGLFPDFPSTDGILMRVRITNGEESRWEYGVVRMRDLRPILVWRWADSYWDDDEEREVYAPREWENVMYDPFFYPGMEAVGQVLLQEYDPETGEYALTPVAWNTVWYMLEEVEEEPLEDEPEFFFEVMDFNDSFVRLRFTDFGVCTVGYEYEGGTATMRLGSVLPDIGWYSQLPTTEEEFYEYQLAQWDFDGENDTVYLVCRDGNVLSEAVNACGSDMDVVRADDGTYATVTLHALQGDWINVDISGTWGHGETFEHHGRGLRVNSSAPSFCYVWADERWDGDTQYFEIRDWEDPQVFLSGAKDETRTVQMRFYYTDEETGERTYDVVTAEDLLWTHNVGGEAVGEDGDCVRVFFHDWSGETDDCVSYTRDGKEYRIRLRCELMNFGWYSAPVASEENYISVWDLGENDTVYFIAINGARAEDVCADCESDLTITPVGEDGKVYAVTIDELFGDRIELRFRGAWNENDELRDEGRDIRVVLPTEGLWLYETNSHWNDGYEDANGEWVDGYDSFSVREDDAGRRGLSSAPGDNVYQIVYDADDGSDPVVLGARDLISGNEDILTVEDVQDFEGEGLVRLRFKGFGSTTLSYTAADKTYSINVRVQLPDIGFYSCELLDALAEDETWLETGEIPVELAEQYYLTVWDYDGSENTILLAALYDHAITDVWNMCGSELWFEVDESYKYAFVTLGFLDGDWLDVDAEAWHGFDEEGEPCDPMGGWAGLHVNDIRPFCFIYTDFDNGRPFISEDRRPESSLSADIGEDRLVQCYLRGEDGELTPIAADEIRFEGPIETETDEYGFLRIRFVGLGFGALYYEDENGTDHEISVRSTLPTFGFYSEELFVDGELPEDDDYEAWANAALTGIEFNAEPVTFFLVARNSATIGDQIWCENNCVIDVPEDFEGGRFVEITLLRVVREDRVALRFNGSWNEDDPFDEEGRDLWIYDIRSGYAGLSIGASPTEFTVPYGDSVTFEVEVESGGIPEGYEHNDLQIVWLQYFVPEVDGLEHEPWSIKQVLGGGPEMTSITLENITEAGEYVCAVCDEFDSEERIQFSVKIDNGLEIHAVSPELEWEEQEIDLQPGETVTLVAEATADDATGLRYQWYRTHYDRFLERINDAASPSLTVGESDIYECWAIDRFGNIAVARFHVEVRNAFEFEWITPSAIYAHPGDDVELIVSASAIDWQSIEYQWYDWDRRPIEGATEPSYTVRNVRGDMDFSVDINDGYNNYYTIGFHIYVTEDDVLYVTDQAELQDALEREEPVAAIYITEGFTIDEPCMMLFDAAHYDNYHEASLIIEPGVTLTVDDGGRIGCAWHSYVFDEQHETQPDPDGKFISYGDIDVLAGGAIEDGFSCNVGTVEVYSGGSCVVPSENYGTILVRSGAEFRTTQGDNCVNYGDIEIDEGAEMEARFGSMIINESNILLDGTFRVGCARYEDEDEEVRDHIWFENYGSLFGSGTICLYDCTREDYGRLEDPQAVAEQVRECVAGSEITVLTDWLCILEQPENIACVEGDTAMFSVVASSDDVSYQWYYLKPGAADWAPVSAASGKTACYSLTVQPRHNGYQYFCRVSSADDSVDSDVVTLTIGTAVNVATQAELIEALNRNEYVLEIHITDDFTIDDDCLLRFDEAHMPYYADTVITIEEGVTLTVEGDGAFGGAWFTFEGDWDDPVTPNGEIRNYGTIIVNSGNSSEEKECGVIGDFTLNAGEVVVNEGGECVVPRSNEGTITVHAGGALRTTQGESAWNSGLITIDLGAEMEARFGTTFYNEESGTLCLNGLFRVGCVRYGGEDHVWFENEGQVEGDGDIFLCDFGQIPMQDMAGAAQALREAIAGNNTVTVSVQGGLAIITEPEDYVGPEGSTATFTVEAESSAGELSYQWYVRKTADGPWSAVKSAEGKQATYSFTVLARHNGYAYYCEVTDGENTVESDIVTLTVGEPVQALQITRQPEDLTVPEGSTASFTVEAEGEGELSYQWFVRKTADGAWSAVKSADGKLATYSFTALARHNGYVYYCEVTDGENTVESDVVTLTVGEPEPTLEITGQPEDYVGPIGSTAVFTVGAEGEDLSYQWFVRKTADGAWSAVKSAEGKLATYSFTVLERHNGYAYYCQVTDGVDTVESDVVTLTVAAAEPTLEITGQPEDYVGPIGSTAVFTVGAEGEDLSYQWFVRKTADGAWSAVKSADGKLATYSFTVLERHNGYAYYCAVTDGVDTVESDVVTLTVAAAEPTLEITGQPEDYVGPIGSTAVFTVGAEGEDLSYQWFVRKTADGAWSAVKSADGKLATYSFTVLERHNGYAYYCAVTDGVDTVESDIVTLTVAESAAELTITLQPEDYVGALNTTATFTVEAEGGAGALSYQWYVQKTADGEWTPITGATAATYSLTVKSRHDGYRYYCAVTDGMDAVESDIVTLTIG